MKARGSALRWVAVGSIVVAFGQESPPKVWEFVTGNQGNYSSVAQGPDGTLYVGSSDHNLYALNPDGTQRWAFTARNTIDATPAVGLDGTIYFGSQDRTFYALNPEGQLRWRFVSGDAANGSPALGADGTI